MVNKYIIRTSDRGLFKRCRREWDYNSKIRHNFNPVIVDKNLEFGTAIHAGLETYYDKDNWYALGDEIKTALAIDTFIQTNTQQMKAHGYSLDILQEQDYKEREELGANMLRYYGQWAKVNTILTPVQVELEFEVPILVPQEVSSAELHSGWAVKYGTRELLYEGLPVVYQGRIDLIAEVDGEYWIVDHKTANRFEETNPQLDVDSQVTSYAWAAREFFGYDIAGVIYQQLKKSYPTQPRVLSSGKLSKDKSQPTTVALYEQAIVENGLSYSDYSDFLNWLKDNETQFVRRIELHRSKQELDTQGHLIYLEALDMIGDPSIYPNPSYWTCRSCKFKSPCLMANDQMEDIAYMQQSPEYMIGEHNG